MIGILLATAIATGDYNYSATRHGQNVGSSAITIRANGDTTEIDERANTSLTGEPASGTAKLSLGADLAPLAYSASGDVGGQSVQDAASISGSNATVTTIQGLSNTVPLGSAAHFVVVDFGTLVGMIPLAAQARTWGNGGLMVLVPAFGQGIPVSIARAKPARPAGVPANDVSVSFAGDMPLVIWYDPATFIPDYLAIPSQDLAIVRQ